MVIPYFGPPTLAEHNAQKTWADTAFLIATRAEGRSLISPKNSSKVEEKKSGLLEHQEQNVEANATRNSAANLRRQQRI
ncbi:unnamed protein product, partial [Amoebophrya sp. A25]|eukprot:GSA25T00006300001.1